MSVRFATARFAKIWIVALMMLLSAPAMPVFAQAADPDSILLDESPVKDSKSEKKKDKDIIQINDRFVYTLAIDVAAVLVIILLIYYPNYKRLDTVFTFVLFNIVIFLLTFVLNKVKISMGAAFGLFAVFSMLRYRTEGIDMKDMTYLFIFIALGLLGGIQLQAYELAILAGVIILITLVMDRNFLFKREASKRIEYERIELIKPENHELLLKDLRERTGLKIHRFSVGKVDFLHDTASIRVYYYEK